MVKQALSWLMTPYYGSNRLSRLIRTKIERVSTAELIGIPLIALVFLAAVVVPQTEAGLEHAACLCPGPGGRKQNFARQS